MMNIILPHPLLRPYIKSYNYIKIPAEGIATEMKFLPTGNPCLVVNLGSSYFVKNDIYHEVIREGESLIIGQQNRYYLLKPEKDFVIFLIIFQPAGIFRLLHQPIHLIGNKSARVNDLSDHGLTEWNQLLMEKQGEINQLVESTDHFFLQRLNHIDESHPYIENAVHSICKNNGFLSVKELAAQANTSERNFRRRFYEAVGLPPKKFILINRLHFILQMMHQQPSNINWADIAYSCGYYDQMHFIKEFKKFSGETPKHYYTGQKQMHELYANLFNKDLN